MVKKMFCVVAVLLVAAAVAGCADGAAGTPAKGAVSREEAVRTVLAAEARQRAELPRLEEEFFAEAVQEKLAALWRAGYDPDRPDGVGDAALRELLARTRAGGYKVETAEGMFFPVIDYGLYKKYREHMTADLAAYIDIMATESERMAAKDNAVVIPWGEVVRRAVSQETFLRNYPASPKAADVRKLYGRYVMFIFYGANNTPLFSYEDKLMDARAREDYGAALIGGRDGRLPAALREYLAVAAANGYRLTDEVDAHRRRAVAALRSAAGLNADE